MTPKEATHTPAPILKRHRDAAVAITAELSQYITRDGEWDTHGEAVTAIAHHLAAIDANQALVAALRDLFACHDASAHGRNHRDHNCMTVGANARAALAQAEGA